MAQLSTAIGDGGLRVGVDPFGAFGSSVEGEATDAFYDPIGEIAEAGTAFESGVAIQIGNTTPRTFLTSASIGESGNLVDPGFSNTSDTSVSSTFTFDNLNFDLTQTVVDLSDEEGNRTGSRLTQTYTITNSRTDTLTFSLFRYFDGDLLFDGSLVDGGGRLELGDQEILFETDTAGESANSTTFIGITSEGGDIESPGRFEVDEYDQLRSDIIVGTVLDDGIQSEFEDPDVDDDGFVDEGDGYDITLAFRNSFTLEPGASSTYITTTSFGSAAPETIDDSTSEFIGDAGDDSFVGTGFSENFDTTDDDGADLIDAGGGDDVINTGDGDDVINAGIGNDTIDAGAGDDTIVGDGQSTDDNQIDGGLGFDTVIFDGDFSTFIIAVIDVDNLTIQVGTNSDILTNVEQLQFDDQTIAATDLLETDSTTTITATDPSAAEEGSDPGEFTITLAQPVATDVSVNYTIGGTATNGSDFTTLSGVATITAGQTTTTIEVIPVDDTVPLEGTETVTLTLETGEGNLTATVTIAENDTNSDLDRTLVFGTPENDLIIGGDSDFDGINELIFTGAGNDEVDTSFVNSPFAGDNRIFTGSGSDIITVNEGDRAFGGSGSDEFYAVDASDYRLSGGAGDDEFFLGVGGRALGGEGDDTFYVGESGGNTLSGGAGADAFWILTDNAALLGTPTTIVDFTKGTDILGIAGQGAGFDFADLSFSGSNILVGGIDGITIATVTGITTNTLTAANFTFSASAIPV